MPAKRPVIAMATPSMGIVSIRWHTASRNIQQPLNSTFCPLVREDAVGGQIAEARNRIVQDALNYQSATHEVTSLLWLDDDVIVHPMCLLKLLSHDRDIAAGVYFTKSEVAQPLIFDGPGQMTRKFVPNQTFETWGWAMGLSLIKLDVFRRTRDELQLPNDQHGNPEWFRTPTLADSTLEDGILTVGGTEDFPFFEKCAKLDIKPLVDTSHLTFGWHYDMHGRKGYPLEQYEQYCQMQPVTWKTPEGEVAWQ